MYTNFLFYFSTTENPCFFWIKYIIINEKCLPVRSAYSSAAKNRFSLLLLSVVTVTKALWFGEYTIWPTFTVTRLSNTSKYLWRIKFKNKCFQLFWSKVTNGTWLNLWETHGLSHIYIRKVRPNLFSFTLQYTLLINNAFIVHAHAIWDIF